MDNSINKYWEIRLKALKDTLNKNNFDAWIAENKAEASRMVFNEVLASLPIQTISWGGSMTFKSMGLYDELAHQNKYVVLDTFEKGIPKEDMFERRRNALLVDLFITGCNAITESGQLVNLDMIGNRTGAINFGPKYVLLLVGRNKIVSDIHDAMIRIKNYTAPTNAMRLDKKSPCTSTSYCQECESPDRICNVWSITEKSFPKRRIKIILINEDLGL